MAYAFADFTNYVKGVAGIIAQVPAAQIFDGTAPNVSTFNLPYAIMLQIGSIPYYNFTSTYYEEERVQINIFDTGLASLLPKKQSFRDGLDWRFPTSYTIFCKCISDLIIAEESGNFTGVLEYVHRYQRTLPP